MSARSGLSASSEELQQHGPSKAVLPFPTKTVTWQDMNGLSFMLKSTVYIFAVDVIMYPADLLTTRLQADRFNDHGSLKVRNVLRNIFRTEGIQGLFRGFGTTAIGSFPGQFSYYLAYEYSNEKLRQWLPGDKNNSIVYGLLANAIAGVTAEAVSAFSYLPTDIISQRLQVQQRVNFLRKNLQHPDAISVAKHIWRHEGPAGFFRGFWPYMAIYGSGSAVWWASYEASKHFIFRGYDKISTYLGGLANFDMQQQGPVRTGLIGLNHFCSGAIAGIVTCIVTNPLDVARTRLQLLEITNSEEKDKMRGGFMRLLSGIYREEGVRGLYKGMKPRIYIKIPGSALSLLGYEYLKSVCVLPE